MDWIALGATIKSYHVLNDKYQNKLADLDNIKQAIEKKGVTVGNALTSEYAEKIAEIKNGEQKIYYSKNGRMYTKNIIIPEGVTDIGASAFYLCTEIESVTFPSSITSINSSSFNGCSNIKEIYIPEGARVIGQNAFFSCQIATIYIPSSLTSLGTAAFSTQYFRNVTLGQNFNLKLNIGAGTYTVDVMLEMFNALKDNTGTTAKTLTLGSTNLAKLTAEQIKIATDKNWNVA